MNEWTTHFGLSPEGQEEQLRLIYSQKMQDAGWQGCGYLFTIIITNLQDAKLMKVLVGWLTPKENLGSCEVGSTHQNLNTGCPQRLKFGCKTPNSTEGRREGTPQNLSQNPDIPAQRHLAVPEEFAPFLQPVSLRVIHLTIHLPPSHLIRGCLHKRKSKHMWGLPWWPSGQQSACQCRGHEVQSLVREDSTYLGQLSPCVTTTEAQEP